MNILYGTLSTNRKSLVAGRYAFALLFILAGTLLAFTGSVIITFTLEQDFDIQNNLLVLCAASGLCLVLTALQNPVYYRFGYTKGRFLALVPLLIIFIFIIEIPLITRSLGGGFTLETMFAGVMERPLAASLGLLGFGAVVFVLSAFVSIRIFEKKDL